MFCLICSNCSVKIWQFSIKICLVIKFVCANLALKTPAAKVLKSGVVIYFSWLWSVIFFSSSLIFMSKSVFLTRLLTLGILFSTVVNAVFVAKLLIFGILFSNAVTFVFLQKQLHQDFFLLILSCLFDFGF